MQQIFYTLAGLLTPDDINYKTSITCQNGQQVCDVSIGPILSTVYLVAGMVAVLIIVIAGFILVTSSGDANRVAKSKQAILGSVVGLVIILLAFIITQFVISRVAG